MTAIDRLRWSELPALLDPVDALIDVRGDQYTAEIRALCETARRSIGQRTRRARSLPPVPKVGEQRK